MVTGTAGQGRAAASTDLPTCYVGISFYRAADSGTLDTAVAPIFNERGKG